MRNLHRALLAGSLGFVLACVAACGSSGSGAGLLNGNQASALQNQLNRISSALSAGDCSAVRSATRSLADQVATLPTTVNGNLRSALDYEANQVNTLSVQQCHPVSTTTATQTTPTATTPTDTTKTTTTPTDTTKTTTTPSTTTSQTTPSTTSPATTTTSPGTNSGGGGLPGTGGAVGTGNNGNGTPNG